MNRIPTSKQFVVPDLLKGLRNEPFKFSLRGAKGDAATFFGASLDREAILAERRHWLTGVGAASYCGALPSADVVVSEICHRAGEWVPGFEVAAEAPLLERCRAVGLWLEPDFLVVEQDSASEFHTVAGAVCFPSHWDFQRALGSRLEEIHGVVPGLNSALGPRIAALLERLPPGESWERANWGFSRSSERNQHPSRDLTRLRAGEAMAHAWLRVEIQVLFRLVDSPSVLFGIRPQSISMAEVKRDPDAREALLAQLQTMPKPMREYKGIAHHHEELVNYLRSPGE